MQTTIDKAGRLVVPIALREAIGLTPGAVELDVDGASIRLRPVTQNGLAERDGRLVIPAGDGVAVTDESVQALRDASRR